MINRRLFLQAGALPLLSSSLAATPLFISQLAHAAQAAPLTSNDRNKVLVVVFQRFGMDGLMAVTPYTDAGLARLRPGLMLPPPGSGDAHALLDLDGRFGLHPAFAPLAPLFHEGRLALVHGVGSPNNTRSHLDAQQYWENGVPGDKARSDGWLNRSLASSAAPAHGLNGWRALALTPQRPRILYGDQAVATLGELAQLHLDLPPAAQAQLAAAYARSDNPALRSSAGQLLAATRLLAERQSQPDANAATASAPSYPENSTLAKSLRETAITIKAGLGMQVAFVESRGDTAGKVSWDSHSNQRAEDGPFWRIADDFARSVAAFWSDLGPYQDDVCLVTLTDFGRTVVENDNRGTDHGRATAMFVLGHGVHGGQVYAALPPRFSRDALEDRLDLPVGIDYRAVLAELVGQQLGVTDTAAVFPGWNGAAYPLWRS